MLSARGRCGGQLNGILALTPVEHTARNLQNLKITFQNYTFDTKSNVTSEFNVRRMKSRMQKNMSFV
jgi:hypothetical protein